MGKKRMMKQQRESAGSPPEEMDPETQENEKDVEVETPFAEDRQPSRKTVRGGGMMNRKKMSGGGKVVKGPYS